MLEHCCTDLHAVPTQSPSLAWRTSRGYLPFVRQGSVRAAESSKAATHVRCDGLSQQVNSPSSAQFRAHSPAAAPQHRHGASLRHLQGQAHARDVRAHTRAPAIPALEGPPYREGGDYKPSQLQAGELSWGTGPARMMRTVHDNPGNLPCTGATCTDHSMHTWLARQTSVSGMQCCRGGWSQQSRQNGSGGALLQWCWAGRLQPEF